MNSNQNLRLSIRMILAAATMATAYVPAHAQSGSAAAAAPAAATSDASDTLETIVITASAGDRSKLNTSTSISSIDAAQIQDFDATSTAELYRMIPGIQVPGTQGDGGNSNIGVRGLRTPTGGSPFVQIQEDGLPVVLFGDIQFGNNDYWTHPMPTDERIEAIRLRSSRALFVRDDNHLWTLELGEDILHFEQLFFTEAVRGLIKDKQIRLHRRCDLAHDHIKREPVRECHARFLTATQIIHILLVAVLLDNNGEVLVDARALCWIFHQQLKPLLEELLNSCWNAIMTCRSIASKAFMK